MAAVTLARAMTPAGRNRQRPSVAATVAATRAHWIGNGREASRPSWTTGAKARPTKATANHTIGAARNRRGELGRRRTTNA